MRPGMKRGEPLVWASWPSPEESRVSPSKARCRTRLLVRLPNSGGGITVRSAAVLLVAPAELVATARYVPAAAKLTFDRVKVELVSFGRGSLSLSHCKAMGREPSTRTWNERVVPDWATWDWGWSMKIGGVLVPY